MAKDAAGSLIIPQPVTADGAVIKDQIKWFLRLVTERIMWWRCLVQFWGLVKIGEKMYLTTCDQPFALYCSYYFDGDVKKLCEYRKHCLEYLIPVGDEISADQIGGFPENAPGRVFRSGLPEYAPDVRDYTHREYPQRDYAVGRVRDYWALRIYHPTRHLPIGVLEIVSTGYSFIPRHAVLEKLQLLKAGANTLKLVNNTLIYLWLMDNVFAESTTSVESDNYLRKPPHGKIAIIDEALSKVRKICGLGYGVTKTWTISGEILSRHRGVDFIRKGQGVVGRAFSSKSACFCRDVRQLSITEYPLVVQARSYKYSACFAVCLQSSCSNNCIYVLEFFLPTNEEDEDEDKADYGEDEDEDKVDYGDPMTLLHSLMETLKECLGSSFQIASGQELGQKLTIEVIKVSPEDEFDSFEICNTTGIESTTRLGEVQGGEEMMRLDFSSQQIDAANGSMNVHGGEGMMQLDFSSQLVDTANACINGVHGQQSGIVGPPPRPEHAQGCVNISYQELNLAGVDVAHNSMNGIYEQQNGIVRSTIGQELVQNMVSIADHEPIVEDPERDDAIIEQSGNEFSILKIAVSRSTLKRICREYGIRRWPPLKERKVNQVFAKQKAVQPTTENTEENHQSDATRLEDDSSMWVIKAKYQEDKIKFELPSSARKIDLEKNIAQRFNLSRGSFKIKYQDELNDWILITCDTDLSFCMKTLHKLGRTTIEMLVS
ncbi:unnamed protein product [Coffea canephora]|uniref:PB1 domain-containing protein n=1 Tax=Coffea canephora TaxID=49390 RepID=A0A068V508_COFCA|nr:unnamed protein product [Coffea canephora]